MTTTLTHGGWPQWALRTGVNKRRAEERRQRARQMSELVCELVRAEDFDAADAAQVHVRRLRAEARAEMGGAS